MKISLLFLWAKAILACYSTLKKIIYIKNSSVIFYVKIYSFNKPIEYKLHTFYFINENQLQSVQTVI